MISSGFPVFSCEGASHPLSSAGWVVLFAHSTPPTPLTPTLSHATIWGTHPAYERGCEALSSHENTRNPPEIIRNKLSWKWSRTHMETSWVIRSDQGWYLTPRDLMVLDFMKSHLIEISRSWQNRDRCYISVVGLRTCGGHSWNQRQKSL